MGWGDVKKLVKVMKAMSDPSRVKILKLLQQKKFCVCELQALLGLAQPTISKHLKLLEDAGLIEGRRDKLWVNYFLAKEAETIYAKTMLLNIKKWLNDDPEVASLRLKSLHVHREEICKK
jgi:ArsR family transcriptional regulator